MKRELFTCCCEDTDHMFVVVSPPEEWAINYPHTPQTRFNFPPKIKICFLYLLGKQSVYGAFGEIILNKSERERLRKALELPETIVN